MVASCVPILTRRYVHDKKRKADEAFNQDTNDTTKSNPNKAVKSDHAIGEDDRALVENCSNRVSSDMDAIKSISSASQTSSTSASNTQLDSILKNIESEREKLLERIDQVEDENNPALYDYLHNSLVKIDRDLKSNEHTNVYFDLEAESTPKSNNSSPDESDDDDVPSMFDDFDF